MFFTYLQLTFTVDVSLSNSRARYFLLPRFPVFFCFPVFLLFLGHSYFDSTFWTQALAYVLHIPGVKHLPAILASVIAHDSAFRTMVILHARI
jgi:hypothetical protein